MEALARDRRQNRLQGQLNMRKHTMHRSIRNLVLGALCLFAAGAAHAQYPNKPVRVIVPYPAGGALDLIGRVLAEKLSDRWKQPVVVDNKPGATGAIGTQALMASAPDGYTLLLHATAGLTISQALLKSPPYDTLRDLTSISSIAYSPMILVVNRSVPADSVKSLIDHLKANPGRLSYATAGIGAVNHVGMELFKRRTGTDITHVPYKGDSAAMGDLLSGNVALAFMSANLAIPQIRAGKLKALAVTSRVRAEALRELPTMIEAGLPDFELRSWNAVMGPAGLPRDIVMRVNQALVEIGADPGVRARFAELGLVSDTSTPEALAERIRAEIESWRAVVKGANIVAE
jgi:tripartite-type tricarboxylate transporter receptor subunit TctC